MWSSFKDDGKTEQVTIPSDGQIGIIMPPGSEICPYVNGVQVPIHHVHVKAGDKVYFEIAKYPEISGNLTLEYEGKQHFITVPEKVAGPVYKGSDYVAGTIPTRESTNPIFNPTKEKTMGMDNISDRVNINLPGSDGGSGAGLAAVIAALGNRNQGNDNAALIAALGNRNDDSSNLAPLMAMMGSGMNNNMNNLWPILLLALLGRGRGGLFGGDDCAPTGGVNPGHAAILQTLLEGQSALRAEVPNTALETQNAVQSAIAQLALGTQQGFANTKDAIQNGIAFLDRDVQFVNQNVSSQGCQTREAIQNDGDKTRAMLFSRFQLEDSTKINELNARVIELQAEGRRRADHDDLRIQISNTNTATATQAQAQAQLQAQLQLQDLNNSIRALQGGIIAVGNQVQRVRADQDIVNLGTMVASGTQATTSTAVR